MNRNPHWSALPQPGWFSGRIDEADPFGVPLVQLAWGFSKIKRKTLDVNLAFMSGALQAQGIGILKLDPQLFDSRDNLPMDLRGGNTTAALHEWARM